MRKKINDESNYKLKKRVKELEEKLIITQRERDNFKFILSHIFDGAIKYDSITSKSILEQFKGTIFKVSY